MTSLASSSTEVCDLSVDQKLRLRGGQQSDLIRLSTGRLQSTERFDWPVEFGSSTCESRCLGMAKYPPGYYWSSTRSSITTPPGGDQEKRHLRLKYENIACSYHNVSTLCTFMLILVLICLFCYCFRFILSRMYSFMFVLFCDFVCFVFFLSFLSLIIFLVFLFLSFFLSFFLPLLIIVIYLFFLSLSFLFSPSFSLFISFFLFFYISFSLALSFFLYLTSIYLSINRIHWKQI